MERLTVGTHMVHGRTQASASILHEKNDSQLGPTSYIFARKEVPPYYAKKMIPPHDDWAPPYLEADLWAY